LAHAFVVVSCGEAAKPDPVQNLTEALGGILIFVGLKMSISHWFHMNTYVSLAIIVTILIAAIIFSIERAKRVGVPVRELAEHEHAHDEPER
jgi:predicted tellurium resistance membrane protein TerC